MKQAAQLLSESIRDPRAFAFGFAIFIFWWVCVHPPEWSDHKFIFMATVLFAASTLILLKRVWSNFVAAVLGGYLPVQIAYEFCMLPQQAEVPFFSLSHFKYIAAGLFQIDGTVLLFIALNALILACAAHTLKRLSSA
jgi:hypothetical protein